MRNIDIIILVACVITLLVAGFDLYNLNQIEKKCLDNCNEHWINEFKEKCIYKDDIVEPSFNFTINVSRIAK